MRTLDSPSSSAASSPPNNTAAIYDFIVVGSGPSSVGVLLGLLEETDDATQRQNKNRNTYSIAVVEDGSGSTKSLPPLHQWCTQAHGEEGYRNESMNGSTNNNGTSIFVGRTNNKNAPRWIRWPVGRGWGGSSRINAGLVCVEDNDDESSAAAVERDILRLAAQQGCLQKQQQDELDYEETTFAGTAPEASIERVSVTVLCDQQGGRIHWWQALVEPLLQKQKQQHLNHSPSNVDLLDGHRVVKFQTQSDNASGDDLVLVQCVRHSDGSCVELVGHHLVCCAGALGTPQLLMRSGFLSVNNDSRASNENRDRIHSSMAATTTSLKGIQDHVLVPFVTLHTPRFRSLSMNGVAEMYNVRVRRHTFQWLHFDATILPDVISETLSYMLVLQHCSDPEESLKLRRIRHWVRRLLKCCVLCSPVYWFLRTCVTVVGICHTSPQSVGSITMKSGGGCIPSQGIEAVSENDSVSISIELPYLKEESDLEALWDSYTQFRAWLQRQSSWWWTPSIPSGSLFCHYCRLMCTPYFHYMRSLPASNRASLPAQVTVADASIMRHCFVPPSLALIVRGIECGRHLRQQA